MHPITNYSHEELVFNDLPIVGLRHVMGEERIGANNMVEYK